MFFFCVCRVCTFHADTAELDATQVNWFYSAILAFLLYTARAVRVGYFISDATKEHRSLYGWHKITHKNRSASINQQKINSLYKYTTHHQRYGRPRPDILFFNLAPKKYIIALDVFSWFFFLIKSSKSLTNK